VGNKPPPPKPLPKRPDPVVATPAPQHSIVTQGDSSWMPPGGFSNRWDCVVIHHSASDKSTPQSMRAWHMQGRGWDELGYHFVIGNGIGYGDGQIFVGERWREQKHGAHCKTPGNHYNEHGIGICLIGDLDSHAPTARQLQSLGRLVGFLCDNANIPKSRVLTHGGITHKTACPGRRFAMSSLMRQMDMRRSADATEVMEADETDLGIVP
jgi:N-acetylmuramoyl-L-alanine amidase